MLDDWIYSHDPAQEELTIERNGDEDYLRELAAEHNDPCAGFEEYTDEEMEEEIRRRYDDAVLDLGDIPY